MDTEIYIDLDGQELVKTICPWGTYIEYTNKHGQLHRLDGPARTYTIGYEVWFKNGLRHREDGPAVVYSDGDVLYFLEGEHVSKREVDLYWLRKQVEE